MRLCFGQQFPVVDLGIEPTRGLSHLDSDPDTVFRMHGRPRGAYLHIDYDANIALNDDRSEFSARIH